MEKLRKGEKINIVTDQWNSPTLNTNLAEMLTEILERKITGIYHLAGAARINRYNFAKLIAKTFGLNEDLVTPTTSNNIKWIGQRPRDSSLDISKASATLHHKPLNIKKSLEILKKELVHKTNQQF